MQSNHSHRLTSAFRGGCPKFRPMPKMSCTYRVTFQNFVQRPGFLAHAHSFAQIRICLLNLHCILSNRFARFATVWSAFIPNCPIFETHICPTLCASDNTKVDNCVQILVHIWTRSLLFYVQHTNIKNRSCPKLCAKPNTKVDNYVNILVHI